MSTASGALGRIGVSASTTSSWTAEQDVLRYADLGVAAIGIWLQKLEEPVMDRFWFPESELDPSRVFQAAKATAEAGLGVSHVVASGRYTETDERRRIDHTVAALGWTAILAGQCLIIESGDLNGRSFREARDLTVGSISRVLEQVGPHGAALAIEPVTDVDFLTTLDQALDIVDQVDHPRVGVYVDVCHVWQDPGVERAIERAAGRILGVHVADLPSDNAQERVPPGEGVVPIEALIRSIEAVGYRGSYDIELFAMDTPDPEPASTLDRSVRGLERILGNLL